MFTAMVEGNLAWVLGRQNETVEAEALFRHAIPILRSGEGDSTTAAKPIRDYAEVLMGEGEYAVADSLLQEAVALWRARNSSTDGDNIGRALRLRGVALTHLGHYELAESVLLGTLHDYRDRHGATHQYTRRVEENLAELYEAWGRPEEAAALRGR